MMTISPLSEAGSMQNLHTRFPPPDHKKIEEQLAALQSAIGSGDFTEMQKEYEALITTLPEAPVVGDDPMSQFLDQVKIGLATRNINTLQEAASTMEAAKPKKGDMPPPPRRNPGMDSELSQSITDLLEALAEDDAEESESALSSLFELVDERKMSDDKNDPLQKALSQVKSALESGDIESAQSFLGSVLMGLPTGSFLNTSV